MTTETRASNRLRSVVGRLPCVCLTCMANNNTGHCFGQGAATCFERRVEGQPINPPHLPDCPCRMCVEERQANWTEQARCKASPGSAGCASGLEAT